MYYITAKNNDGKVIDMIQTLDPFRKNGELVQVIQDFVHKYLNRGCQIIIDKA